MERPNISFFAMCLILLFAAISFIFIVFDLHRFAFVIGLMTLLVIVSVFIFSMFIVYHNKKWGWTILGAGLILLLVDVIFVLIFTRTFETAHMTTISFSVLGLLIAFLNLRGSRRESGKAGYEKAENYYPYIDKMEVKEDKEPKAEPQVEKTFTPGKYIASKKANKFHVAKCDWASRIGKANQVWFNSIEEAKTKGFEADKCVG